MAYPWIKMRPLLMLTLLLVIFFSYCLAGRRPPYTLDPQADGFWANKTTWNARWVKYWRAKKIYEPVWKKVWTPTIHNEWVPLPNVPNEWEAEKDRSYKDQ
ncbi:GD11220 [Drosophila simulans]|uniref:GD11220 n=1 Tax=Drosophila simulans TaxID=7240 RepID=B4QIG0_DROSI|nr:GD11220 [Drosophila simulans]